MSAFQPPASFLSEDAAAAAADEQVVSRLHPSINFQRLKEEEDEKFFSLFYFYFFGLRVIFYISLEIIFREF